MLMATVTLKFLAIIPGVLPLLETFLEVIFFHSMRMPSRYYLWSALRSLGTNFVAMCYHQILPYNSVTDSHWRTDFINGPKVVFTDNAMHSFNQFWHITGHLSSSIEDLPQLNQENYSNVLEWFIACSPKSHHQHLIALCNCYFPNLKQIWFEHTVHGNLPCSKLQTALNMFKNTCTASLLLYTNCSFSPWWSIHLGGGVMILAASGITTLCSSVWNSVPVFTDCT